jgi:DNA repair exonuclease SbcCD nuclease subunit
MKILHTGDWHICSLQYGKRSRADAIFSAARQIGPLALKHGADFITNSGDILDSGKIGSYEDRQLDAIHEQLVDLKLTMYTLTGNHDMDDPPWISRYSHPDNYGIVSVDNRIVDLPDGSRLIGFMTKTPKELFERLQDGAWRDTDIAMWHGGVAEFTGGKFGRYPTVKEIMEASPIKNWLLADIHVCRYIEPDGGGIIGYPGPVEMTDINESIEKFATLMEFDRGKFVSGTLQQIPIKTAPVYVIPLCSEQDVDMARRLLAETSGTPRMIWFQFIDEFQASMNDLFVYTTPDDVIREKNVTVRKVEEIVAERKDLAVDIRQVTQEETDGLPEDIRAAILNIVDKTTPAPVVLERLITAHETSII